MNNAKFSNAADEKLEQQDNADTAEEEATEQLEDSEVDREAKEEAVQEFPVSLPGEFPWRTSPYPFRLLASPSIVRPSSLPLG